MKRISLIDSISNNNNNLSNVHKEDYFLFKDKFNKILFLYFYFFNNLLKIYFSRKVYKLLRRLTSLRFKKMNFKKNNVLNYSIKRKIKKKIRIRRKRLLFISRITIKFYKKKIIFFKNFIRKYHKILNLKKNNSYINFFYQLFSVKKSDIFTKKKYNKDNILDYFNDYFNFDKIMMSKFFKFKIKNFKNNQLVRIIYFLKKKFNWKLINNFRVISLLKPLNRKINICNYLSFFNSYSFNYLQVFKPVISYYIQFVLKNKINFLLKIKIIKLLFIFNKKLIINN